MVRHDEGDGASDESRASRTSLPIERAFPIERINEIAEKEGRAKQHYRPIYTMHKWWARRLGCVFRSICLYSLLDADADADIEVTEPGNATTLGDFSRESEQIRQVLDRVDATDPSALWDLYPKDVTVEEKKLLDPFMGGGTSIVEASRFGAEVVGNDLNPVAWFVTKKEVDAGSTDLDVLDAAFEKVRDAVGDELQSYYRTPCPNVDAGRSESPETGHLADVMHYLWVKELDCGSCGHAVPLFSDYRVSTGRYERSDEYVVYCPGCDDLTYVGDWHSESTCEHCSHEFVPEEGTVERGEYTCTECGETEGITDAISERGGYQRRLYAVEYYCPHCDEAGRDRSATKGFVASTGYDARRYDEAATEWADADDLRAYVPDEPIPEGAITTTSTISGNDVFQHGYDRWTDMFNERQLLALSKLLRAIDGVEDDNAREFLLLAFSDMLRFNNAMVGYQSSRNHINDLFQTNSFDPQQRPAEANVWGTEYGMGSFRKNWEMVRKGVSYANAPTERYVEEGETVETEPFGTPVGENVTLHRGDMRTLDFEDEFDAVVTDPPYYDNIIYSEVADYFYVCRSSF
jgi:adenine-specific DNA methylase